MSLDATPSPIARFIGKILHQVPYKLDEMKRFWILAALGAFLVPNLGHAQTWTLADSPHTVDSTVIVPAGSTLTIEAGSEIIIDGGFISVAGTIDVQGTAANPVVFQGDRAVSGDRAISISAGGTGTIRHAHFLELTALRNEGTALFEDVLVTSSALNVTAASCSGTDSELTIRRLRSFAAGLSLGVFCDASVQNAALVRGDINVATQGPTVLDHISFVGSFSSLRLATSLADPDLEVRNSILSGITLAGDPDGEFRIRDSIVFNSRSETEVDIDGSVLRVDPRFENPTGLTPEALRLMATSPAIDAAKATGLATDAAGGFRPFDGDRSGTAAPDIGAFEFDPSMCGDGIVEGAEVCDDGADNGMYGFCNDGCSASGERCGDAVVNGPEVCDDGANNGMYGFCDDGCSAPGERCGDAVVNGPEVCDDGNTIDGDGCSSLCEAEEADAGVPDAGLMESDAGVVNSDGGVMGADAGTASDDAGIPMRDAGPQGTDAGLPEADAASPDSSVAAIDAGPVPPPGSSGGCTAAPGNSSGGPWMLAIAFGLLMRRRRR